MTDQEQEKPRFGKKVKVPAEELGNLHAQIDCLQKEKADLFAKLQRLGADYDNYQKRVPKQIADAISLEKEAIIKSLLSTLDNLERTLASASSAGNADAVIKGVQIIYDQFLAALKLLGIEQIAALGQKFDPAVHHALTQRSEQDKEDNLVTEQLQTGYKLNGRVIRPARVVVNKLAPPPPQPEIPADQKQQVIGEESETRDTQ